MTSPIQLNPTDSRPIWHQIESGVEHLVASAALPAGSPIPSVREMARELRVNPATVSKAYQRLVDHGVLIVRRGEGTFVAERSESALLAAKRRLLHEASARFAGLAKTLGCDREEILQSVDRAWRDLQPWKGSES